MSYRLLLAYLAEWSKASDLRSDGFNDPRRFEPCSMQTEPKSSKTYKNKLDEKLIFIILG